MDAPRIRASILPCNAENVEIAESLMEARNAYDVDKAMSLLAGGPLDSPAAVQQQYGSEHASGRPSDTMSSALPSKRSVSMESRTTRWDVITGLEDMSSALI